MQFCTKIWASASLKARCAKKSAKSSAVGMLMRNLSIRSMWRSNAENICTVNLSLDRLLLRLPLVLLELSYCWAAATCPHWPALVAKSDCWEIVEVLLLLEAPILSLMLTHSSRDSTRSSLFLIAISTAIIAISDIKQPMTLRFFARYPSKNEIACKMV